MAEDIDEFIEDFRIESHDSLGQIEAQLLEMENGDEEAVNIVFRAMHSLKGGSSFLDLIHVNRLAHALENILDLVRQGLLNPSREMNDLLLRGSDLLLEMIDSAACGQDHDIEPILAEASHFLDHGETIEQTQRVTKDDGSALELSAGSNADIRSGNHHAHDSEILERNLDLEIDDRAKDEKKPFGQFLIDHNYLTADLVFAALIEQERRSKPDLEAFLDVGLEISDCMYVANIARRKMIHPLRVACELGYLGEEAMEQVNDAVQSSRPPIGQTLRELGYCDSVESRIWLQLYYDYCNDVESEDGLEQRLHDHQLEKKSRQQEEESHPPVNEDSGAHDDSSAQEAGSESTVDASNAGNTKNAFEEIDSEIPCVEGATIECETSLIIDYQEYATEDLRTDIENMLLFFDDIQMHSVTEVQEQLKVLFRIMHSLKGSAGFIGAEASQFVVHQVEESIILIQRAPDAVSSELWSTWVSAVLTGVDIVWELSACIGKERSEHAYMQDNDSAIKDFLRKFDELKVAIAANVQLQTQDENIEDLF